MKKNLTILGVLFLLLVSFNASALEWHFDGNFQYDNDMLIFDFYLENPQTITIFSSSWGTEAEKGRFKNTYGYVPVVNGTPLVGDGGGFDPILEIWTGSGTFKTYQDDGEKTGKETTGKGNLTDAEIAKLIADNKIYMSGDQITWTYGWFDSYFTIYLEQGWWSASVAQFDNFSNRTDPDRLVTDKLKYDGNDYYNTHFTQDIRTEPVGQEQDLFNGIFDGYYYSTTNVKADPRTSYWAFHIIGADQDPGPEIAFLRSTAVPEPGTLALLGLGLITITGVARKKGST